MSTSRHLTVASQARNRAFVFVKPHAVTDKVKELVRTQLQANHINVASEGTIDSADIDRDMLIDNHYYAIASKATLLAPDQMPVPVEKFNDFFGVEFASVLKSGQALNAKDACERFRLDADGLGAIWAKAKDAGKLVKFGGGFYCAEVEAPSGGGLFYIFNGFFMQMRNAYVQPGNSIHWFAVDWSPMDLAWTDFRSKVLGPTDAALAPADSIRGMIFANWQELGLASVPNVSQNGVHASASPMEALFERCNWLNTTVNEDLFGVSLLDSGISLELIEEWRRDPQVSYGKGDKKTKASLYDCLEDLDVDRCIVKCKDIARSGRTHATVHKNRALCFVKPHALTREVKNLVRQSFEDRHMRILQEGVVEAQQMDEDMLIDKHYYAIASKATLLTPDKLHVPADMFKAKFGKEWSEVLKEGSAWNAKDACDKYDMSAEDMQVIWNKATADGKLVKFSGGFYCAEVQLGHFTSYVFNGFFMNLRNKFVKPGAEIYYFVVEWDPMRLSWSDFRNNVLGPTDPTLASEKSIRGMIYQDWQKLGLSAVPNISDNGVHASASPVEALFERMNWLDVSLERDAFGKLLLQGGVTAEQVDEWSKDPQVVYGFGPKKGSFYDLQEDKDTDMCLEECLAISRAGHTPAVIRNSAFVFIKPHAINEKTKEFARKHLQSKHLHIQKEGLIDAATIDEAMLIDKHYYAIASKATLLEPSELPVPGDKFQKQFGIEWQAALAGGNVVNAKQACEKMGVDALGLSQKWVDAKAAGNLVKLGGGFYCGKIEEYYVFNGFFMEMRNKYVAPGAAIYYFAVEWDPLDLSWADFRGQVLGGTDPSLAPEDSLRGLIYAQWEELGLAFQPNIGDNGVHASASPFEALAERMNWLGLEMHEDSFGQLMLHSGITKEIIEHWALDPQVTFEGRGASVTRSLYDSLEDLDADRCVTQCQIIVGNQETAGDTLNAEEAEALQQRGNTLAQHITDGYDVYSFKYYIEDPNVKGPIWEVIRDLEKQDNGMYGDPIWYGRKLTAAEAQQVLHDVTSAKSDPKNKPHSPLNNRLPGGAPQL